MHLSRVGMLAFVFFLLKGVAWLLLPAAAAYWSLW
jgi:hypothetical protein